MKDALKKQELWDKLKTCKSELKAYHPVFQGDAPRYTDLQNHIWVNPKFFADCLCDALQAMPDDAANNFIRNMFENGDTGNFFEVYGYKALVDAGFSIEPHVTVRSTDLFRSSSDETDLDGKLKGEEIYFDIKTFPRPTIPLQKLKNDVESALKEQRIQIFINGPADFDATALEKNFGKVKGEIVKAAKDGLSAYTWDPLGLSIRIVDLKSRNVQIRTLNAYQFAENNRYLCMTNAKQVHRSKRFFFVYVYTDVEHELPSWALGAEVAERSIARRTFIQLQHDQALVQSFCPKADSSVSVGDISKSIGGIFFVRVKLRTEPFISSSGNSGCLIPFKGLTREAAAVNSPSATLSVYLNPNAASGHKILRQDVWNHSNWDPGMLIEDFEFDNY